MTLLNDGIGFASASNDLQIKLWSFEGDNILNLDGHTEFVYSIATTPNGQIVSSGEDRSVKIWQG